MNKKLIGKITHYFEKANVCVIELCVNVKIGDKIFIETDDPFEQEIISMEINKKPVKKAKKGEKVGIKLNEEIKGKPKVYLI